MKKTNKTKIGYFIISHGRPNEQLTYKLLRSGGVETDDIFIVCDDLDTTLTEYIQNYGDRIVVFDKQRYMDSCDSGVQSPTGLHAVYASECQEDLAASILYNQQGKMMFSCGLLQQSAIVEGRNKEGGGIEGHYDKSNDYYRHFGTLIYVPATIAMRLDSNTFTKKYMSNYYPMILSDRWKK